MIVLECHLTAKYLTYHCVPTRQQHAQPIGCDIEMTDDDIM